MPEHDLDPAEIERQYLKSPYVKELCVLRVRGDPGQHSDRLFAVVVPDLALIRRRRIVNVGDLLRFEMEGQSIGLPPDKRVSGFDIWFEALPRTASGTPDRVEIERRLQQRRRRSGTGEHEEAIAGWAQSPAADVIAIITRRANGRVVRSDSNLEIDLGLDSMDRVELITELEQQLGLRLPEERAPDALTVSQLLEALESTGVVRRTQPAEDPWGVLLKDLPPMSDPVLGAVFERHVLKAACYALLRAGRLVVPRIRVTGIEHLPARGPYIISPNHQSFLDPFYICSVLPYRIVRDIFAIGAVEYFETPLMTWAARQLNLVAVDPDAHLVPAMKAAAVGLNAGKVLILFPEGERTIDGTVKHFKKGAAILSRHLGVPIVPVAIGGAFDVWPRNRPFNWRALLPWKGHRLEISFGPPMRCEAQSDASCTSALRQRVSEMCHSPEPRRHGKHAENAAGEENG